MSVSQINFSSVLKNPSFLRWFVLICSIGLVLIILVYPINFQSNDTPIESGRVASEDIQAPYTKSYTSQILTDEAKNSSSQAIGPVYLPADPSLSRQQIEKLEIAIDYINVVRNDEYATRDQKISDLIQIESANISEDTAERILDLSDTSWQTVQSETLKVLEQVMRGTIREDRLSSAQRSVSTLISYSLTQDQSTIVNDLASAFVTANSLYSEELTQQAQDEAKNSIEPISRNFVSGETIVERGQIITPLILEALEQYDLVNTQNHGKTLMTSIFIVILVSVMLPAYFYRSKDTSLYHKRSLFLVTSFFFLFLIGARFAIYEHTVIGYIIPIAAFGMTISSLFNPSLSIFLTLIMSILAGFNMTNGLELTLYYFGTTILGSLALGKGHRISSFFWSGMAIGGAGSTIALAYNLPTTDFLGATTLVATSFLNGLASASLTLLFQHFFAQILSVTTAIQLLDISRPDHPLMQMILTNAPGTYQHSLQVANLAERAAEAIGADSLLTRVGAIFHDAGKAMNPSFFIENKLPGQPNPHDNLDPITSSAIIIQHVADGIHLARKHRVPTRIQDFIREHHGTLVTRYQYTKAVQAAGNNPEFVNMELFRYPGPKPRSRETALLMLADICEAKARAELPTDEKELRILVKKSFEFCQQEGQLDNTTFTLRELNLAIDSFVNTLKNTHHLRIKYPTINPPTAPREALPDEKKPANAIPARVSSSQGTDSE